MIRFRFLLAATALSAVALTPAVAQRNPTPEQRIDRLEKQVRQVQKQVFPKGQPADTAGFSDQPAATQDAVSALGNRLDAVERQMADIVRTSEENSNRVSTLEAQMLRMRADFDQRLRGQDAGGAGDGATSNDQNADQGADQGQGDNNSAYDPPPPPKPKVETKPKPKSASTKPMSPSDPDYDSGAEADYDVGYRLWMQGKYGDAHDTLIVMAKKYPDHRRASWAYNLAGRSLLDQGKAREAAEELLANYRRDPKGERAQDSVFYLGQSLMKLGQAGQACKAYAELEGVYAGSIRPQLAAMIPAAKSQAKCK